ncbi:sensor histidine kinase [Microbacterium sp. NPDC089987]|uniref:sensor histidine kinase n=1 Tax=Microbacterium sp. NPDC089987 TaxID=3364202 RepID=UPI0038275860
MRRSLSILRWQLVCTSCMVSVAMIVALLKPSAFGHPLFLLGLAVTVLAAIGALLVPWSRVSKGATMVLPFVDILAIGFASSVQDMRVGFLWVIPVAWLATYYSASAVAGAVAFVSGCLILFAGFQGTASDTAVRVVITVLALSFLGTSIQIGARRSRATRRLLRRQSEQINRAAERAAGHQRRVTDIIDALDTALVVVSSDGDILKMNEAYRTLYGRDRYGAELPAQAVEYDDHRGEPLRRGNTVLARAARGEQLCAERVWLYDTAGRWRALNATTQRTARLDDGAENTLLILDDITEQLEASEERRRMVAIVSHELRNPLTALIGHVELLLDRDDLPARVHQQLEVMAHAGERMQRLAKMALDTGRAAFIEPEPVDLRVLADAAVELFLPTAAGKGLTLSVVGLETLMTSGDAFRLRQAIDNVLSNAVKYTPRGGSVILRLGISRDERAQVTISDTGRGIAPEDLERLFEPYFRAPDAVHSGISGTGLGMGIVRAIVDEHHGEVTVTSRPGEGTHVEMRFPDGAQIHSAVPLLTAPRSEISI